MSILFDEFDYEPIPLLVEGEIKELEYHIPFFFPEDLVEEELKEALFPVDPDDLERALNKRNNEYNPDNITYEMLPTDYDEWTIRFTDLEEIWFAEDQLARYELDEYDNFGDLDSNIENTLRNVEIVSRENRVSFRALREFCGASQAVLAEALDVNPRTVKRWESPNGPEIPDDAWTLLKGWKRDVREGAEEHVAQALNDRENLLPPMAYQLVLWRSQEEFDEALAPLLATAPKHGWQASLQDAKNGIERKVPYTDRPGTRSFWRANAAAKLAAVLMETQNIGYGFVYVSEVSPFDIAPHIWVPCVDIEVIPRGEGEHPIITCGMR